MDVLLIDDDPMVCEDLAFLLPAHIMLRSASGSEEAARILKAGPSPDAIILDLCLPSPSGHVSEEEGFNLLRLLKYELAVNVPVIVLSALPLRQAEARCLGLGACLYLEKPCRVADLVWILTAVTTKLGRNS